MTQLPPPTDDVARFVELIGAEAALKLLEERGGSRLYVSDPGPETEVTRIVGLDAATKLHEKFGRNWIKVPFGRQWRVVCYIAMGLNRRQTAQRAGCTENTVHDILQRHGRPAALQLNLFR
jgi:hypothetical protein